MGVSLPGTGEGFSEEVTWRPDLGQGGRGMRHREREWRWFQACAPARPGAKPQKAEQGWVREEQVATVSWPPAYWSRRTT